MTWRLAKSLEKLRAQINVAYPDRSKSSDGTIGDARHQASKSEHNPDANGVVRALDITHDPAHGVYARKIVEALAASRDSRILYLISDGQICSSVKEPWKWRTYSGSNAHRQHFHISVVSNPSLYDDVRPWSLPGRMAPVAVKPRRFNDITATVFSGPSDQLDNSISAYGGKTNHNKPGVALPCRFLGKRPQVRVFYQGKSVVCDIVDVGPWNINDDYWNTTHGRPQAESGRDRQGRVTNLAGIDLTPAAARAIGLRGKAKVDWEFVQSSNAGQVAAPGVVIIGGGSAAVEAASRGSWGTVLLILGITAVLAVGAYFLIRRLKGK